MTQHLTHDEVTAICGHLEDLKVAEIIGTGATAAELEEAVQWIAADDAIGETRLSPPTGRVAELVEILTTEDEEWDEP